MKHFYLHLALWSTALSALGQTALDPTFGTAGTAQIPASGNSNHLLENVVTLSDNKLIAFKTQVDKSDGSSDVVITRLLPNGSIDQTFGNQGHTTININAKDVVADVEVLGYDVLLVAGTTIDNSGKSVPFVTKVNTQGDIDAAFGIKTYSTLELGNDFLLSAATLSIRNNRVILAGYGTSPYTGNKDFAAIAIDFVGNLFYRFGGGGIAWLNISDDDDICTDVNIWPYSSSILLTGYSKSSPRHQFTMALLQEDGSYNPTLRNTGKLTFNVSQTGHDRALKAAIDPIYNLVYLVGYSALSNREVVAMASVTLNGLFQSYFDIDGKKVLYIGGKNDRANNIAIAGDGNIYVSGTTQQYDNSYRPYVLKLQGNGSGDAKWAPQGIFTLPQSVLAGSKTGINIQNLSQVVVASLNHQSQNTVLSRFKDVSTNKAKFISFNESQCDARVQFSPLHTDPYDGHRWFFGDNTEMNTDPVALHQFAASGYYDVLHVYKESPDSNDQLFFQRVFADKWSYVYSAKFDAGNIDSEHNVFLYATEYGSNSNGATYSYQITYPGATQGASGAKYDKAGFYPYHYTATRTDLPENACASISGTGKFIVANQYSDCDPNTVDPSRLGSNLVTNGNFDLSCHSTPLASDYWLTCSGNGYTSREVSVVSDVHEYSQTVENGYPVLSSVGTPGLNGNFLYVPEKENNLPDKLFFHAHIAYLDIWRQQVYVEAGHQYYFKTNVVNISHKLADQYAFPYVVLAVDEEPLKINMINDENSICDLYTASKTGWVTLRIIKYEGVPVGLGSLGIDDIYFGKIDNGMGARTATSQETLSSQIELSPNPATAKVMVNSKMSEESIANGHIEILSISSGKLLKRVPATTQTLIDVSELTMGMYMVKVISGNGDLIGSQKLVISQ